MNDRQNAVQPARKARPPVPENARDAAEKTAAENPKIKILETRGRRRAFANSHVLDGREGAGSPDAAGVAPEVAVRGKTA